MQESRPGSRLGCKSLDPGQTADLPPRMMRAAPARMAMPESQGAIGICFFSVTCILSPPISATFSVFL